MTRIFIFIFLCLWSTSGDSQVPGTRLTVDVNVTQVAFRGDTTLISYVVHNRSGSQDSLMMFIVDAPGGVSSISRPAPDSLWSADSLLYGVQPAAIWGILGLLPPAGTSPVLTFESVGLPGILSTWSQGSWPIPTCCEDDSTDPAVGMLELHSVKGKTVGVEPWPTNRSVQALMARLRSLTEASCATDLLWITEPIVCAQLLLDIDQAELARSNGQHQVARTYIGHYKTVLSTGATTGSVTNSGVWLLRPNADVVEALL